MEEKKKDVQDKSIHQKNDIHPPIPPLLSSSEIIEQNSNSCSSIKCKSIEGLNSLPSKNVNLPIVESSEQKGKTIEQKPIIGQDPSQKMIIFHSEKKGENSILPFSQIDSARNFEDSQQKEQTASKVEFSFQ